MIKKFSKIKVGVFMGGRSIEREVSLNSGRTICDHLDTEKYEIIPIFQTELGHLYLLPWHFLHRGKISDFYHRLNTEAKKIDWEDLKKIIDFMYLAVHGRYGEDGIIQGFLEILDIPYLGTKVYGSSLGMNKIIQKKILQANQIEVAKDLILTTDQIKQLNLEQILKLLKNINITFPLVVKPAHEGSSLGINIVINEDELLKAIYDASYCDPRITQEVLIEEKLKGMEFVCVCLQKSDFTKDWFALSVTEVITEPGTQFYDYTQKYMPGRATKITPARCSKKKFEKIISTCIKASQVLQFTTISRIDGFLTKDGKVVIIDPNSLTGMSPATFLFHQAAEKEINHPKLINYLIETELKNYGLTEKMKNLENKNQKSENKKRIAILLAGNTNEKEISLESGRNICYKLSPQKYEVIPIFVDQKKELYKLSQKLLIQNSTHEISNLLNDHLKIRWSNLPKICDFVFIGLHGGIGENGSVQGTLEMLDLPYNGSGIFTSSLCIDKYKLNQFLKSNGFDTPKSILICKKNFEKTINKKLNDDLHFPLIIKPVDDGCSFYVKKANTKKQLLSLIKQFFKISSKNHVLIEEYITGTELTCGVIGNEEITVFPPSKTITNKDILSIEEKFLPGAGENLTPAPLPKASILFIQNIISNIYKILDCKGYARIDCFYQSEKESPTKKHRLIILEVNTLPALTPATCIFHQAAEIGLKPMEFIDKIIEFGIAHHKKIINPKKPFDSVIKNQTYIKEISL
ncbi:ATP-grasp domain-containing protein [Candidatus Dependentiae bacterium]|nr:ATP-grasp domain-containing protein [Candidatus Dependentiae bacterium]